jgi:hypothetical protein
MPDAVSDTSGLCRLARRHDQLDALDLYSRVTVGGKGPIGDTSRVEGALGEIRAGLLAAVGADSTLHGWRAQALFEAIVASLGTVQLLKLEDAGDVYFTGAPLKPPDFRIVTEEGEQILVEVKNFHPGSDPTKSFRLRRSDLDALREYTTRVGVPSLKLAVYWVAWNLWTLFDASALQTENGQYLCISLPGAVKINEMATLGDRTVFSEWPLALTFYSDPGQPRAVDADGRASFTIGAAEYSVAGRAVKDQREQQIVHRLILHGGWPEEVDLKVEDGLLISVSFAFSPAVPPPSPQPFAGHAPLSSMFSTMFMQATANEEGEITSLRIDVDPSTLGQLIPDDFEGETLKLWRVRQVAAQESQGHPDKPPS